MSCHPIYSFTNVTKVEYDNFFMRAAKCIFIIQKLCTWQFLSVIPFGTINMEILWRIFYTPHLDYWYEHHGDFRADITDWKEILSSKDIQLATVFWQRFFQLFLARSLPQHGRLWYYSIVLV